MTGFPNTVFPYSVLPCTENQYTVENVENFHSKVTAVCTLISDIRAECPKCPSTAILVPYPYRITTHPICTAYSTNGSVFRPEMIQLRKPIKITGLCQMRTAVVETALQSRLREGGRQMSTPLLVLIRNFPVLLYRCLAGFDVGAHKCGKEHILVLLRHTSACEESCV